jgi:hypothetical protein
MKDIIIGAIHNYSIPNIKNWVGSIKSCSFDGTKIIIFYDDKLDNNTIDYLNQNNFIIYKGFLPPGIDGS